jgi:hypothetical protein
MYTFPNLSESTPYGRPRNADVAAPPSPDEPVLPMIPAIAVSGYEQFVEPSDDVSPVGQVLHTEDDFALLVVEYCPATHGCC